MPRISNFYFDEAAFAALPVDERLWHAVQQSEYNRAKHLLEAGAGPNLKHGVWNNTPLHLAVLSRNADMVSLLLKSFCDVDERNHAGTTPLMLAVRAQDFDMVKELLDSGMLPAPVDRLACLKFQISGDSNSIFGGVQISEFLMAHSPLYRSLR